MGRRGGSGSSGGGTSCEYCNRPLTLSGWDWKNGKINGIFALTCLSILVVLVCLGLMTQFKWTRHDGRRDTPRTMAYLIAAVSYIIYGIFGVVDTGLRESNTETTYLYYLTYIFSYLFSNIEFVVILWVVLRTAVEGGMSRTIHKFSVVNLIIIGIIAALAAAVYGMQVAQWVWTIKDGDILYYDHYDLDKSNSQVTLALLALYFVATIYAIGVGSISLIKARSLATLFTDVLVIPAIFIQSLLSLALYALSYDSAYNDKPYTKSYEDLSYATEYIGIITNIIIFLGLAVIGILRPKNTPSAYGSQQQKNVGYA